MLVSRKFIGSIAAVGMLISSGAWAFDLPNDTIPPSGAPAFYNNVTIDMNDNGSNNGQARLQVKGRGDFHFDNGDSFLNGINAIFKMTVFYNDLGEMSSGDMHIKGGIADLGIAKGTTLMTATIDEWNLHDDPNLWAFGTTDIVCSPLLLVTCTQNESVYISLLGNGGFDGNFSNGRFLTSGFAVTTIPIPAAAWLFGSALGLLGWVRSRNRRSSQAVA
jgi:hypothetical protein